MKELTAEEVEDLISTSPHIARVLNWAKNLPETLPGNHAYAVLMKTAAVLDKKFNEIPEDALVLLILLLAWTNRDLRYFSDSKTVNLVIDTAKSLPNVIPEGEIDLVILQAAFILNEDFDKIPEEIYPIIIHLLSWMLKSHVLKMKADRKKTFLSKLLH